MVALPDRWGDLEFIETTMFLEIQGRLELDHPVSMALYETCWGEAYRVACSVVGDECIAEDLAQETLLAFLTRFHHFDRRRHVLPYLRRIAHNLAVNWLEREREDALSLELLDEGGYSTAFTHEADKVVERGEMKRILSRLVDDLLDDDQKEILRLYFAEDWTYVRIASHLGCSDTAVRKRMKVILRKFRTFGRGTVGEAWNVRQTLSAYYTETMNG